MSTDELAWVPDACTLPTADRPMQVAEFDDVFTHALRGQRRVGSTRLRLFLAADAEGPVRDLIAREMSCCAFFTFTVELDGETLVVDVAVPGEHVAVLDALEERATERSSR